MNTGDLLLDSLDELFPADSPRCGWDYCTLSFTARRWEIYDALFPDTDSLSLFLAARQRDIRGESLCSILRNTNDTPLERIRKALHKVAGELIRPDRAGCVHGVHAAGPDAVPDTVDAAFREAREAFAACLVEGQKDGSIRADMSRDAAVRFLASTLCTGIVLGASQQSRVPLDIAIACTVDGFLPARADK